MEPHEPGRSTTDVVVIGGGIVGVATAAHVAETGRRVVLVERATLGSGASGRNSGVVQHPFDAVLVALHLETLESYRRLSEFGLRLSPRPNGLLNVTLDPPNAQRLVAALSVSHPGLEPTYLPPGEVTTIEPAVSRDVAACRLEIGYAIAPLAATQAYGRLAEARGVDIVLGAAARPVVVDDRVRGVSLDDGRRIDAGEVVVTAGPWTPALVDPTGRWSPIRPLWGVVASVTLADPPHHVLEEAEITIEPDDGGGSTRGATTVGADYGAGQKAFSLVTADGMSSLGSTFLDAEPDPAALVPTLVERGARFVPAIADALRGPHRSCARPLSRDGRPLIGRAPGVDGLWIAAGHGPWGISTGPASGRLVADLIAGRVDHPPPALDPARFGSP